MVCNQGPVRDSDPIVEPHVDERALLAADVSVGQVKLVIHRELAKPSTGSNYVASEQSALPLSEHRNEMTRDGSNLVPPRVGGELLFAKCGRLEVEAGENP